MFGQFGHFYKYGTKNCDHPYPLERYATETQRLLRVLDTRLESRTFLVGEQYTLADMSIMPWVYALNKNLNATDKLNLTSFKNVNSWMDRLLERPLTLKGMDVCKL